MQQMLEIFYMEIFSYTMSQKLRGKPTQKSVEHIDAMFDEWYKMSGELSFFLSKYISLLQKNVSSS